MKYLMKLACVVSSRDLNLGNLVHVPWMERFSCIVITIKRTLENEGNGMFVKGVEEIKVRKEIQALNDRMVSE